MPRDKYDKYDSPNPRRTHTFMSAEDVAAGKKSTWTELEITGTVRNLGPDLWKLQHLTSLYLNLNSITRIPPEINRLTMLTYLDLSSNKLRSLPSELGDLSQLRELLLNNNLIRMLPFELGKLFNLQTLGLKGNPLSPEILNIYNQPNGTQKLLSYMLDNLPAPGQGCEYHSSFFFVVVRAGSAPMNELVEKIRGR
ncbi:CCR4-NOT transcription complex subunit 6-like [Saccostrea echinata]|uniref:CCR4-NOT transcription complex subunit 6-like n=1 Tax=Saccostrea echinata TaxID=191078 RepID=UPI002A837BE9|nr:CCR4-NOT transcription complex subunit 6-like [Saccostrea echinata]